MIPKVFHRIFLDEPVPERFEVYWRRFQELHPDWGFITWDDSSKLGWMRCRKVFEAATTHAGRADVLRYEIMWRHGGVYVDTDVEPLRAFDDLLVDERPFIGWENERLLCPTVLGSPPAHPAYDDLLQNLPVWAEAHRNMTPNVQTGPNFLTRRWRRRTDVRLLPREAFYPVGWWEKAKLGGPYPPESYSVHHWAAQWLPGGPPQYNRAIP